MRALNDMRNQQDIMRQRNRLNKELKRCEKACTADAQQVRQAWKNVGRIFSLASSSFTYLLTGLSIAKHIFCNKKA